MLAINFLCCFTFQVSIHAPGTRNVKNSWASSLPCNANDIIHVNISQIKDYSSL